MEKKERCCIFNNERLSEKIFLARMIVDEKYLETIDSSLEQELGWMDDSIRVIESYEVEISSDTENFLLEKLKNYCNLVRHLSEEESKELFNDVKEDMDKIRCLVSDETTFKEVVNIFLERLIYEA